VLLDHRSGEGFSPPIASKMFFARCHLGVDRLRAAASKASALFPNCKRRSKNIPVSGAGAPLLGEEKGTTRKETTRVWSHRKGVPSGSGSTTDL
jgi:hypothetical protein